MVHSLCIAAFIVYFIYLHVSLALNEAAIKKLTTDLQLERLLNCKCKNKV